MKKIFFVLCLLIGVVTFVTPNVAANDGKDTKKEQKEQQKRLQEIADSVNHEVSLAAIKNMSFLLRADRISFKSGRPYYTESNTNFIYVNDGKSTVQLSSPQGGLGANGMGGITVEGTISNVKTKVDKKGNTVISYNINGISISASVTITLYKDSNQAYANVNPNFNSRDLDVYGVLTPFNESKFVEGISR